jgi:hypothetical protein
MWHLNENHTITKSHELHTRVDKDKPLFHAVMILFMIDWTEWKNTAVSLPWRSEAALDHCPLAWFSPP